ncbi:PIG-L family deacetylase [Solirubrum puertoriconensis]|uniref:LmbE family protein n=1 Tax=Solirubrum puertoriconensis TaxID=1751427 RepID=A0A9X0HP89_SOLP1|nr:PIG-L family deacetylase [Solirubrum puertoriconensis]KUG09663.1 LmbE family protein [Solirubrum puertoriconensis]
MLLTRLRAVAVALLLPLGAFAQAPKTYSSSEILLGLKKLNVLGSVLYIAAHPDDENTRMIAYLANGRLMETGYFSCTRGDGGQNLIGPELREALGVIRTQELLAARRIDGGKQFFSRANDFGFSKTAEETFTIWDKEQVLADMVWVIRQRRPDVLITRFPPDSRAGHGHHTASAMLALEAFDAAGDPKRFPEQLQYVQPWQPKRLFWNTGSFFVKPGEDMSGYLKVDAGGYNALLGQSYGEIAARSRSQHQSQGMGASATRGEAIEYLQQMKGEKVSKDPFEGIDVTWRRLQGKQSLGGYNMDKLTSEVIRKYDPNNPAASVAGLIEIRELLMKLTGDGSDAKDNHLLWAKLQSVNDLIRACLGLHLEVTAAEASVVPGQVLRFNVEAVNRSATPIEVQSVHIGRLNEAKSDTVLRKLLRAEEAMRLQLKYTVPVTYTVSQPYWLRQPGTTGMYVVADQVQRGDAENGEAVNVAVSVKMGKNTIPFLLSAQYKRTDPVYGELYRPLTVVPPVAVNLIGHAYVFAENQPKTVPVTLKAGRANAKGTVALQVPAGWKVEPASIPFELKNKDEERTVEFQVQPTGNQESAGQLRAVATVDGQQYSRGIQNINYTHIPAQTLFPEAVAPLVKLELKRKANNIGYLMGAGDEVPDALRQIGYSVTLLKPEDISAQSLRRFDAVVLGVRAYNTVERLRYLQPVLLDYVEKGGNLVVQYVVNRGTVLPEIGPYPLKLSSERVTVENAPVKFLKPQHPLLNAPNKITERDFQGWVQEQGLYYPSSWDAKYQTIISSNDPGESAKESAILVAEYGKGHYIYTGLSFFRELPAGVPGAYRLFTNMIELGKK